MAWLTFGTATSPEPMSALDTQFNNVASGMELPCTASGTNAISLTPLVNFPSLSGYNELGGYRFVAVNTSTGLVTLQYNGLGFLPVYHADGVTQANVGDFIANQQYIVTFHQALNAGGGGFFFLNASTPTTSVNYYQPGGRLTLQSATPGMFTTQTSSIIYYAPYQHSFVPIYNGATMQNYQFTSSLSDQVGLQLNMGGAVNFPVNGVFDVFATLIANVPTLVATQWTNATTRATTLSVFGGLLTNSGSMTAQTGPNTSTTVAINQGTFLGTFYLNNGNGSTLWRFGGAASGGVQGFFSVCNYYNPVLFVTSVVDNGAPYTYTAGVLRQARASTNNQINFVQCSSERMMIFTFTSQNATVGVNSANCQMSIGFNSTSAAAIQNQIIFDNTATTAAMVGTINVSLLVSYTGLGFVVPLESSDSTNANTFDRVSTNNLQGALWL